MQKGISKFLNLCKIPELNRDYQHTVDFSNLTNQINFFNSKVAMVVSGNYIIDSNRAVYLVEKELEQVKNIDYLYTMDNTGKYYYYFVIGVEYKTKTTTLIYVELDVLQTFLFDFTILNSFVDRCHVPRWNSNGTPRIEIVPEDLQLTAHSVYSRESVYNYTDKGAYIITSSEPLGKMSNRRKNVSNNNSGNNGIGGGNTNNGSNGDWKNGVISSNGFRMMKGYEAYAPYKYQDSGGYWTIGYGVTKHGEPTIYNQLVAKQPVPEEECAKVGYNLKINNYGKKIVNRCIELGVTKQQQFDALCDLGFNAGVGVITGNNSLTNAIKKDITDKKTITNIWKNFYTSDGVNHLQGLVLRRTAEANVFFNGIYEKRSIPKLNASGKIVGSVTENNGNGWLPEDNSSNDTNNDGYNGKMIENSYGKGAIPTHGTCSATFPRYPSGGSHSGVDIANVQGTPIYAWKDGIVRWVGKGYGLGVAIDSTNCTVIYGHNSKVLVTTGERVKMGQKIALMGSTGNSTGNHLHFEVRPLGGSMSQAVNPWFGIKVGDKV